MVIKPDMRVDLIKKPSFEIYGLTQVNLNLSEKILKNIFKILIFHMKKIKKQSM
jgi:hypothetical protein